MNDGLVVIQPPVLASNALAKQATETAASATAATARAMIEARYGIAYRFPRDIDSVRVKLLQECRRPRFAEAARYQKPIGKDQRKWPSGPSIRFAEACMRVMGNIEQTAMVTFDDVMRRIIHITITDLETNSTASGDVSMVKTMERRFLPVGETPIETRVGASGQLLYVLHASDDDVQVRQAALISKMIRTLILRMVPSDIVDECMDLCIQTAGLEDAKSPDETKKAMFDKFSSLGVSVAQIKAHVGHECNVMSPTEIGNLRALYNAIREGETTWKEVEGNRQESSKDKASAAIDAAIAPPAEVKQS